VARMTVDRMMLAVDSELIGIECSDVSIEVMT
jgi:hypothetical protein